MRLAVFNNSDFLSALKEFFKSLNVPINYLTDQPATAKDILQETYKENAIFQSINEVYFLGIVDDAAFEGNKSLPADKIKSDYDGILIFGVTLNERLQHMLPTRSQLAEISRAFNREYYYTPVVVVFKYGQFLAFSNTERLKYRQDWREGEKAGKVTLLRDISLTNIHQGHERILNELRIPDAPNKRIDTFQKLYVYWQEVFNVNLLNRKFYLELSNWYFWAVKQVTFPSAPNLEEAHEKKQELEDLKNEHNSKNIIRMLTRILFVWFIKEKKLIPDELFDLEDLQRDHLKEISPYHEKGLFKEANQDSVYYRAILQNLFFATLNCPIVATEPNDNRVRGFRKMDHYGQQRGADFLMRYEKYFKDPGKFLQLVNEVVPFLNGGLFECLDDKLNNIYIDGFSDQMARGEQLIVPDYLFFGVEEKVDLSKEYGLKNKGTQEAAVKGLINILKSYKFTITENTPIEEEIALDPELLGKVFENLLASYNPETKSTARKQTGSFYTPRDVVSYMVDESLIGYLKGKLEREDGLSETEEYELNAQLCQLLSYDPVNPFLGNSSVEKGLIEALDSCTILDPACGSGAFPMGILQKMVHILQKLDPNNVNWKELQKSKVMMETAEAFEIEDKNERQTKLIEINNAFDESTNSPDYARKLFLIENCIYGVDIQPIATQITKLRFFISLVVDQKVDRTKDNFGIRPLPNLETKFVAADTLRGIEKPNNQMSFYDTPERATLERSLKRIRHRIFSSKTPANKKRLREQDKEIREKISIELEKSQWPALTARKLAEWDPYNLNASSAFFDAEWMFDIHEFDMVIGNPPYVFGGSTKIGPADKAYFKKRYFSGSQKINLFTLFIEKSLQLVKPRAQVCLIVPNTLLRVTSYSNIREYIYKHAAIIEINDLDVGIFEGVTASTIIIQLSRDERPVKEGNVVIKKGIKAGVYQKVRQSHFNNPGYILDIFTKDSHRDILSSLSEGCEDLLDIALIIRFGVVITNNFDEVVSYDNHGGRWKRFLEGEEISRFKINYKGRYLNYNSTLLHRSRTPEVFEFEKIMIQRITGGAQPIKAAYDDQQYYNKESIINLQLKNRSYHYLYVLALLNSALINWFYKQKFTNNSKLTVNLSKEYLGQIPIKKVRPEIQKQIGLLAAYLMNTEESDPHFQFVVRVIDGLVLELYFGDHLEEKSVDILKFVQKDLNELLPITPVTFLTALEHEKIKLLVDHWNHPDHEVRNRINLAAVRSPDVLKPILESK